MGTDERKLHFRYVPTNNDPYYEKPPWELGPPPPPRQESVPLVTTTDENQPQPQYHNHQYQAKKEERHFGDEQTQTQDESANQFFTGPMAPVAVFTSRQHAGRRGVSPEALTKLLRKGLVGKGLATLEPNTKPSRNLTYLAGGYYAGRENHQQGDGGVKLDDDHSHDQQHHHNQDHIEPSHSPRKQISCDAISLLLKKGLKGKGLVTLTPNTKPSRDLFYIKGYYGNEDQQSELNEQQDTNSGSPNPDLTQHSSVLLFDQPNDNHSQHDYEMDIDTETDEEDDARAGFKLNKRYRHNKNRSI
ncbi:hypothetical protein B0H66DRAFT_308109 [Apodospora peruviana]|uniref:Uncharacterized protein n=1 Tax=Apodospora peruviana TaxID=516989 RepID=A0AAE0M2P4_9PEZI|nr:hypothetical protein B0H66DRAFT_308109 [Apodospora peruviana]